MVTPRCPYCNTQGLKHLALKNLGLYSVVYCGQCGAIYGVIPTPTKAEPNPIEIENERPEKLPEPPEIPAPEPSPDNPFNEIGYADLTQKVAYSPEKIAQAARSMKRSTMYRHIVIDDGPPHCLTCKAEMRGKITIPPGYPNSGRKIWICPNYHLCKGWELSEE